MSDLQVLFRPPDQPPEKPYWIDVKQALTRGRCSGCCMCHRACWTWWSPNPPSGYVPLHSGCIGRLFEHWQARPIDSDDKDVRPAEAAITVRSAPRIGAYARLTSTVAARPARGVVALSVRQPAVLPDGFTPGPFWLPGDSADSPWTVVAETAAGWTLYPRDSHENAYETAVRLGKLRETSDRVPVVAATLVDPQGCREAVWGELIDLTKPTRWRTVVRLHYWAYCRGCDGMRWPGTWVDSGTVRCLACLAVDERDDPRPALMEPSYPGDRYVPEEFTKAPKPLALPKGFGRRR